LWHDLPTVPPARPKVSPPFNNRTAAVVARSPDHATPTDRRSPRLSTTSPRSSVFSSIPRLQSRPWRATASLPKPPSTSSPTPWWWCPAVALRGGPGEGIPPALRGKSSRVTSQVIAGIRLAIRYDLPTQRRDETVRGTIRCRNATGGHYPKLTTRGGAPTRKLSGGTATAPFSIGGLADWLGNTAHDNEAQRLAATVPVRHVDGLGRRLADGLSTQ